MNYVDLSRQEWRRAMVELCRVKESEVEPWYNDLQSSRVK